MRQEAEFQAFYEANYGRIVAMVTALLGDRLQAEDVAQEAFARAYSRWGRIGHYEVPEAWVRQVAMRLGVDAGLRMRRAISVRVRLAAQRRPPAPSRAATWGSPPWAALYGRSRCASARSSSCTTWPTSRSRPSPGNAACPPGP